MKFIKSKDQYFNVDNIEWFRWRSDLQIQRGDRYVSEGLVVHLKSGKEIIIEGPKTLLGQFAKQITED